MGFLKSRQTTPTIWSARLRRDFVDGNGDIKQRWVKIGSRFLYLTLGNAWLERLHTGTLWAEGPV